MISIWLVYSLRCIFRGSFCSSRFLIILLTVLCVFLLYSLFVCAWPNPELSTACSDWKPTIAPSSAFLHLSCLLLSWPHWQRRFKNSHFLFQIHCHSLTARSVPRQFREDLRKGKPFDRNIRIHHHSTPNQGSGNTVDNVHIIYDSENKEIVPYPDAEVIRTPSPEHVGIPAGPVKMPPIRSWKSKSGSPVGYTSDDSCYSDYYYQEKPPPARRKLLTKQSSNPGSTSVKSLVEKYNVWALCKWSNNRN